MGRLVLYNMKSEIAIFVGYIFFVIMAVAVSNHFCNKVVCKQPKIVKMTEDSVIIEKDRLWQKFKSEKTF